MQARLLDDDPPFPVFSSALQSVPGLFDDRRIIAAAIRFAAERHAPEQPEINPGHARQQRRSLPKQGTFAELGQRLCLPSPAASYL